MPNNKPPWFKRTKSSQRSKSDKEPRWFPNQPHKPTEEEKQQAEQRILEHLGGYSYWMVNKAITRKIGVEAAIFLADLLSKYQWYQDQGDLREGYFFNTQEHCKKDTGLSRRKQRRVIKILVQQGILYPVIRKGVPPRLWFKFCFEVIEALFFNNITNHVEPTGLEKED